MGTKPIPTSALPKSSRIRRVGGSFLPALLLWTVGTFTASTYVASSPPPRPHGEDKVSPPNPPKEILVIATAEGSIEIELFEAAAPAAVQRLMLLVGGLTFKPALTPTAKDQATPGFYDGLTFDFTRPHVEIVTATREPSASFTFTNELDAEALGLDRQLVSDTAEAMNILQRELLVAHRKQKKSGQIPDKLKHLLEPWFVSYTPDYLIGVTRKEVNEALGYVYQSGLESKPAVRGSVLLKPISPTHSSARLSVLLADIPERTGRWMVIGRVVRGLDVAEAISVRPRLRDRSAQFRPVNPVVIDYARLVRVLEDGPSAGPE